MKGDKITILLLLLAISIIWLTGSCNIQTENPAGVVLDVSVQEAVDLIEKNRNNPDFVILDVRTPEEFGDGHIENAVNIDFRSPSFESEISELDREKVYLVYCRTGNRSSSAVEIMSKLGFREIYHLDVGITGWIEEGLIVIN